MITGTPHKPVLEALRQRLARHNPAATPWPVASSGLGALDEALPGGGIPAGMVQELVPAAYTDFAATLGFGAGLLTRLARVRPGLILWVLPRHAGLREGRLYPLGLTALGLDPARVLQVVVPKTRDVLWTLEEALVSAAPASVVGLLPDDAPAYDFTASRRLSLRAAESGGSVLLIRTRSAGSAASAADLRWRIAAAPSARVPRHGLSKPGLGPPRWDVELVKSKRGPTGLWQIEWDHETLSFRMASPLADRAPLREAGRNRDARAATL